MFISVSPFIRVRRGLDSFTYQLPDDQVVQRGQIVLVPWRKQRVVPGVVMETSGAKERTDSKMVKQISQLVLPEDYLQFIEWFAQFYAISLCLAWRLALPTLTKKLTLTQPPLANAAQLRLALTDKTNPRSHTIIYARSVDLAKTVCRILARRHALPAAVLVADNAAVVEWKKILRWWHPLVVTSEQSPAKLRQAFGVMLSGRPQLFLGTKRLSLFPVTQLRHLLLIDPEESAHKQWDLNPRYHVQRLADRLASQHHLPVTYFSYAPRLEQMISGQIDTKLVQRCAWPKIHYINMEQQPLISWPVMERLKQAAVAVLWYQRKGGSRYFICRACAAYLTQKQLTSCPNCGSHELRAGGFGTGSITQVVQQAFPDRPVIEITQEHKPTAIPYRRRPIIVATTAVKHCLNWQQVEYAAVVSIDQQLAMPFFRAHEWVYQQLVWLRNHLPQLDIQTYVPEHPVFRALTERWPEWWYQQMLQQRQTFHYPPAGEYYLIRNSQTQAQRFIRSLKDLPDDPGWLLDREL